MNEFAQVIKEYGGTVVLSAFLLWLVLRLMKESRCDRDSHREERKEWKASSEKFNETQIHLQKDTNEVLRELTKVISESNKNGKGQED